MAVASRAMGFGMDILGNDIVQREEAARYGLLYTSLNDLLAASDIVTIHTPLTSATRNLIGARELRRMKDGALLVNTARAGIIRTAALEKSLATGHLGGFAADVLISSRLPRRAPDGNAECCSLRISGPRLLKRICIWGNGSDNILHQNGIAPANRDRCRSLRFQGRFAVVRCRC